MALSSASTQELATRMVLASALYEAFDFAFEKQRLNTLYEEHRGRCYEDTLTFPQLVCMVRDCLLEHGGSGHRYCTEAQRQDTLPVDQSSFYRKLANMPVNVSRALLKDCTRHLGELMPPGTVDTVPVCFDELEVVVLDGKPMKKAAKRLKPTRGYTGSLLGAKALVAMSVRRSLALAMSDSLDGEANELPLTPEVLPQVREVVSDPILWLADRQFGDLETPRLLSARPGDHYVVRMRKGIGFKADPSIAAIRGTDAEGRSFIDEIGTLGSGKNALVVRRVSLHRPDADEVVLISDLLDRERFGALDLLKLYRRRWGIEMMFQQVTETFSLDHLIGSTPKAVLFQFAFCLLMYNLVQLIKTYVARDGKRPRENVSTANLFYDVKRELSFWNYWELPAPKRRWTNATTMQRRLRELLKGSWDPIAYTKAVDKSPRKPRKKKQPLHGGHTSVQRLLEEKVKLRCAK